MAYLRTYIENLRKEIKPEPTPSEDQVQKAEAYDYITGRSDSNE